MENLRQALRSIAHSAANQNDKARYKSPSDCVTHLLYIARRALDNHDHTQFRHDEGGVYTYVGLANGAGASKGEPPKEIYIGEDGRLWFRGVNDFGKRFTEVKPGEHNGKPVSTDSHAAQRERASEAGNAGHPAQDQA